LFRATDGKTITGGTRRIVPAMTGIMALCLVLVFMLNSTAASNPLDKFSPPSDFEPVAEIDLSAQDYSAETLAEFTLNQPAYVDVFINVRNINTRYFDLRVVGPDGFSSVILHGEGYRADRDGGLWSENLFPGTYQVVLTSEQSPGSISVSLQAP
jgi:hypothetical protein